VTIGITLLVRARTLPLSTRDAYQRDVLPLMAEKIAAIRETFDGN
jgi:hypothetical protein